MKNLRLTSGEKIENIFSWEGKLYMTVDRPYCMSSYLMYRYVFNNEKTFSTNKKCNIVDISFPRTAVKTADDLVDALQISIQRTCQDGKAALALSGGIDSAILAKLVPKGTKAYTFRCIVPGKYVIDESKQAHRWAKLCGLDHEVIDITWDAIEAVSPLLMKHKGAPIHSIEAQIYLAALHAKENGAQKFIFGENADIIYGGMDGLLARDWLFAEFVDRYTYIMPYRVLKDSRMILDPFKNFEIDGHIDGYDFVNTYFRQEALGTYNNACETAGIQFAGPYSETQLDGKINYQRIRSGDTKYIVREAFKLLYPKENMPQKIPMPRPTEEWFADWHGPQRAEFWPHCTDNMSGDQKWMVWALEKYLDILDEA